jgi:3-deoxy-7-phosphoheptulonate synthase
VLLEVHHDPERALSDGPQSLLPETFAELARSLAAVAAALGTRLAVPPAAPRARKRTPRRR